MSHFPVIVAGDDVAGQLQPFDEDITVEPYLDSVEGEWAEELRKAKEFHAGQPDPTDTEGWTDQDFLDSWSGEGVWRPSGGPEGFERWSTYNPAAKWDWWVVGGRWDPYFTTRDGRKVNECLAGDLDLDAVEVPHALLIDGEWTEAGRMGWFGIVLSPVDGDAWVAEVRDALAALDPQTRLTAVDAHI